MFQKLVRKLLPRLFEPKVYIDDYNGIAAHFETLPVAFAIQKAYGHPVFLDWKELDAFSVEGTKRKPVRILARIGAMRLRPGFTMEEFQSLGDKKIICRAEEGPGELVDPVYLETSKRIKLHPDLVSKIKEAFSVAGDRPVVGVHIRRGDFELQDNAVYDPTTTMYPATPIWWYDEIMAALVRKHPDVMFYVAATGNLSDYQELLDKYDIVDLGITSPYKWKGAGHQSEVHPIADLFALACCSVILATPVSGYAHWAANVLGEESKSLIPLKGATPGNPMTGVVSMYGQRMSVWRDTCLGKDVRWIEPFSTEQTITVSPANTEWL